MEPDQDGNTPTTEPIRFRAGKKRKAYRQRPTEEEEAHDVATVIPAPSVLPGASKLEDGEPGRDANADAEKLLRELEGEDDNGDDGDDRMDEESAVAAALRLRNARRAARRGAWASAQKDETKTTKTQTQSSTRWFSETQIKMPRMIVSSAALPTASCTRPVSSPSSTTNTCTPKPPEDLQDPFSLIPFYMSSFIERQANHSGMNT
jgi:hypothetical protein